MRAGRGADSTAPSSATPELERRLEHETRGQSCAPRVTPGNPINEYVERLVVTLKLRDGMQARAADLIAAGPPFEPADLGLKRHSVYLGDDLVIFVFEGEDVDKRVGALVNDPVPSASFAAWTPLLAGTPALAHENYHWEAS